METILPNFSYPWNGTKMYYFSQKISQNQNEWRSFCSSILCLFLIICFVLFLCLFCLPIVPYFSNTLRRWTFDERSKKITPAETQIGVHKRIIKNVEVGLAECGAVLRRTCDHFILHETNLLIKYLLVIYSYAGCPSCCF